MRFDFAFPAPLLAAALAVALVSPARADIVVNIDKTTQRMTVSVDGEQRYEWPVSTGRAGYDTPNGTFKINRMDADHLSQEWDNAPMPHAMFFDMRGHAIHGFFDVKHLGLPVSHGCVRIAPEQAAILFKLVQAEGMQETKVIVAGETPRWTSPTIAQRRPPAGIAVGARQPMPLVPPGYAQQQQAQQQQQQQALQQWQQQQAQQQQWRQQAPQSQWQQPPTYGPQYGYRQPQTSFGQAQQPYYAQAPQTTYVQPQAYYYVQPGFQQQQYYVVRPYNPY
jgi:L,D-transpeptidase catalytic domain